MQATTAPAGYREVVEAWYREHNDSLQRILGTIIHRKGSHGEGDDEMRAELNYWVFRHVESSARRRVIDKVKLSMAIEYAYRHWAGGKRSYHDRQGRHDLREEATTNCHGDEWSFPPSRRPNDPAMRARFNLDMQIIGRRLPVRAQRVLRAFIKDPHATDRSVSQALGRGCRYQYVFDSRQIIKAVLARAGYYPPPIRPVDAPPEIRVIGRKAVCVYGACQRTPNASYADIARRLGCQRSHVRWALQRFLAAGVPWAEQFIANNAQGRCYHHKNADLEFVEV